MGHSLSDLQGRSDGRSFQLVTLQPTTLLGGGSPLQPYVPRSGGFPRVSVSWTATYRGRPLTGDVLVADANLSAYAQQLQLDAAWQALDSWDLRWNTFGKPFGGPVLTG